MALLPVPTLQPPASVLSIMEVHLVERQCLPNLPVFSTGKENTLFQHRNVPEARYTVEPGVNAKCLGVSIDAKPPCTKFDDLTGECANPTHQRVAIGITGVVSLLCPSTDMQGAVPGQWVEVDLDVQEPIRFRGYGNIKTPRLAFETTPSMVMNSLTRRVLIGRLLIKDPTNNYITIDLCPL